MKLAVQYLEDPLILGGGSNVLPIGDIKRNVLRVELKGVEIEEENGKDPLIHVGAGENWHQLVLWALDKNLGGIENLSLIPGTIGAAPMQNIGAYGVELESVFHSLDAVRIGSGEMVRFKKKPASSDTVIVFSNIKVNGEYVDDGCRINTWPGNITSTALTVPFRRH